MKIANPIYDFDKRKLQQANEDEEVQGTMDVEDEILAELEMRERHIDDLVESLAKKEDVIAKKENELSYNKKILTEKDLALTEKDLALTEKDQLLKDQMKIIEELKKKLGED